MYLKSLQLVGFKSFADKTSLEFLPGVTAVVGPNGCGKSNIADAIRWVLGEQSAKALRGGEMADVIFSGTDGRKPIGVAEVHMTFADVDPAMLSLPGVNLDYSEITITRRVYRDGTGEYLINRTPCRLRDIQNLFMDTGIGRSSYSLMAQGQIDQILSARPDDRRMIFEEAAGISKYKHQKKEALRKLEYTEQNLLRITDVIKELKRQIISLQRQAGKARRYKELFNELKGLETRLSRHKFDELNGGIVALESEIAAFAARSEEYAARISEQEEQINTFRRSLAEIDRAISDAVSRDHELRNESDRHQQRIGSNHERITEFEQLIANHHREIAGSEEKIRIQENTLVILNEQFNQIDTELAREQEKLREQQELLRALDAQLADKSRAAHEARSALLEVESRISGSRNELAALDHKHQHDIVLAQRLSTEKLHHEEQRRALEQRLESFNAGLADLRQTVQELRGVLASRENDRASLVQQLNEVTEAHQNALNDLSKKSARLEVLRQLFAAPNGRATLANILQVESPHGAAIEAALSHNLRVILADNLDVARSLLSSNMKNPVVTAPELAAQPAGEIRAPEGCVVANHVVRVSDGRFEPLVRSLLGNVLITGNLATALQLRARHPGFSFATRAGELVSASGVISAVSSSHIAEISNLTDQIAELKRTVNELAGRRNELQLNRSAIEEKISEARAELHTNEVALASKEGELNAINTDRRDIENKIQVVLFELGSLEKQQAEEKDRRAAIQNALAGAESREIELREQVRQAQAGLDELTQRKQQVGEVVTELRVSVGGIEYKRTAINGQREPIAGRVREYQERIQTCHAEIAGYTNRIEQFRREIVESQERMGGLAALREESRQHLDGLQHQRGEVAMAIEQSENELRSIRMEAAKAQQQKSTFDVAMAQKRMEVQNLKEKLWAKYQVNVEEIQPDAINVTIADQGAPVTEQVPLDTNWDAVEQQVAELQSRLDAMGSVNVAAIEEYDELEDRYKHMTQQHDDLVKSKDQLLAIISRINTTTKELFSETFEKIRTNFQQVFTELFGGGKANLVLLDENDPLESGIEIVAKPPGKQLQSISLLSGGEKTLTATALLFSIYMVKPSPFCVLDELDAPLDESNINRFIRILQRFVTQSQFVIITHNKRTIGMADALYGITMEEHGVSKVVSVKFSSREEVDRKQAEQQREAQEDRIDGAAQVRSDVMPHEEPLRNELLEQKEATVAPVPEVPATPPEA